MQDQVGSTLSRVASHCSSNASSRFILRKDQVYDKPSTTMEWTTHPTDVELSYNGDSRTFCQCQLWMDGRRCFCFFVVAGEYSIGLTLGSHQSSFHGGLMEEGDSHGATQGSWWSIKNSERCRSFFTFCNCPCMCCTWCATRAPLIAR